jgi:hypothetical protein
MCRSCSQHLHIHKQTNHLLEQDCLPVGGTMPGGSRPCISCGAEGCRPSNGGTNCMPAAILA